MFVCMCNDSFGGASTRAYTRTQARGAWVYLPTLNTACVRVYARVLVLPNLYIHTGSGRRDPRGSHAPVPRGS